MDKIREMLLIYLEEELGITENDYDITIEYRTNEVLIVSIHKDNITSCTSVLPHLGIIAWVFNRLK